MIAPLVVAAQIAAGVVVDAGAAVDARAIQLGAPPLDPTAPPSAKPELPPADLSLAVRPRVSAAAGDAEGGVLTLTYTPQISFDSAAPKNVPFFLLNTADVRGQMPLGRRLQLRAFANGAYGALDPASAQAALSSSNGAASTLFVAAPYATGSVGAGGSWRAAHTLGVDVDLGATTTLSPGGVAEDIIPSTTSGGGTAGLTWQIDRPDALVVAGDFRAATVEGRGSFYGGTPLIGWRRDLLPGTGIELRGGLGVFEATATRAPVFAPSGGARGRALLHLGNGGALALSGGAGLDVVNDPLGALLEDRASANVGVAWRVDRQWSFHVDSDVFAPLPGLRIGAPKSVPLSDFTMDHRASVAWALVDKLAVEVGVQATTRLTQGFLSTDTTATVSLVGSAPVWHTGGRPPGSDPRPGRDVGVAQIGTPPPLGATTIEKPEPLPQDDEEPNPATEPPLVAPPPNQPIVETPLKLKTLRTPTQAEKDAKKKADAKKKLKHLDKDGKLLDAEPKLPDADPHSEPK